MFKLYKIRILSNVLQSKDLYNEVLVQLWNEEYEVVIVVKANIIMSDGTELKDIVLFTNKNLGDSQILSKIDAEKALQNNGIIFFSGKYVQGGISTKAISHYFLYEDNEYIKSKIFDFVESVDTIYDKTDIANFISDYREEILDLIK